jgi:CheY-like chemotaxis protein
MQKLHSQLRRAEREVKSPHAPIKGNVLCVDADDESRHLIAELLYECEVDFALTADDAVQLAHCRSYDLYFVDPAVPGFGERILDELRLYDRHVPLIICGAGPDGATSHDASARLQKPLCPAMIRLTAARLLAERLGRSRMT